MAYILRRRGLGFTSVKGISLLSRTGIQHVRNDRDTIPDGPLCFRWGCTASVPTSNVVNNSRAIHLVNNKTEFRRAMNEYNYCPATWFDISNPAITFPCIVRPKHHHQGRNLHLCNNYSELEDAIRQCGSGYYISEYIRKEREFRIYVCMDKVMCVAEKIPENREDVAWNHHLGSTFHNVRWNDWPIQSCKLAIVTHQLSGLDFSGVDIMVDNSRSYVLESNSAPSLTSPYRQRCFAKVFDYIVEHGKEAITSDRVRSWRDVIHPAITY